MPQFIIPTIFTASNQLSRPVMQMQQSMVGLGNAVTAVQSRMVKLQSVVGEDVSNRINFMVSLAKGMAVLGTVTATAKAIKDYDDSVSRFRVIVSDLNNTDFSRFKEASRSIALATRASTIEVTDMFTAIAGLDDRLAKTPQTLGMVTQAAITLQRAGFMPAEQAARSLVTTLTQFGYGADQSNRVINAMAAGQNRGAFSINQTSEALVNFGATAKGANMNIENAVGLIQTLAASGIQAAEAGTALNAVIMRVQASGRGYKSGRFDFVEGMQELYKMQSKMTPRSQDAFVEAIFGKHRATEGRYLLNHIEDIKRYTTAVTGTQEAVTAAAIANASLSQALTDVRNKWITLVTTSASAGTAMGMVADSARWLTRNMENIIAVGGPLLAMWGASKVAIYGASLAIRGYSVAITTYNFLTGLAIPLTGRLSGAMLANAAAARGAAIAMTFMNAGLAAQLGIVGAVAAGVYVVARAFANASGVVATYNKELNKVEESYDGVKGFTDPKRVEYTNALKEYDKVREMQAWREYAQSKGGVDNLLATVWWQLRHPVLYAKAKANVPAPSKLDYVPASDTANFKPIIPGEADTSNFMLPATQPTGSVTKKDSVNVYVSVDKSGNVKAHTKTEYGPVPVNVIDTGFGVQKIG